MIKTEMHGTGGGRWTTRADAKQTSKKARRVWDVDSVQPEPEPLYTLTALGCRNLPVDLERDIIQHVDDRHAEPLQALLPGEEMKVISGPTKWEKQVTCTCGAVLLCDESDVDTRLFGPCWGGETPEERVCVVCSVCGKVIQTDVPPRIDRIARERAAARRGK